MARKRKRTWPQRVYRYAVTSAEIPQQMWDQAKAMQRLWNDLADEHRFVRQSIVITDAPDDAGKKKRKTKNAECAPGDTPEDERIERWEMFNRRAVELVEESGLNWECGPDVLDRFTKACVAAAKTPERGWPHPGSLKVSIPHRFTGGGAAVATLHSRMAKRVRFDAPLSFENRGRFSQDRRIITGRFGLDNDAAIEFVATVHTPIPPEAIVKSVRWVGRETKAFGWRWWLVITVEEPPREPRVPTGKRVAIDVGWRKRGDALRVAYFADSDGRHGEILLPLDFSNRECRKFNERLKPGHFAMPRNHDDLRVLACDRSCRLDECKRDIEELVSGVPNWDRLGRRGLIKLLNDDAMERENRPITPDAAKARIEAWLEWDRPRFRVETASRERFANRRMKLYEAIAADFTTRYDEIVVEDLGIKQMAEDASKDAALKAADCYRQIAAPGEFVAQLQRAGRKRGAVVTKKTAVGSTATCCLCGGKIETGPTLELTCINGHKLDQDHNAAKNLLSQTWGVPAQKGDLRTGGSAGGKEGVAAA